MYNIQVRAKTSAAEGRWSELVPLGKFLYCDSRSSSHYSFKCIIPCIHAGCRNTEGSADPMYEFAGPMYE